ncbi:hypothetical protein E4U21_005120 [Claviceps maximensis]|nr:hypothetical protein E4U21_005120 [Claviceps maximensis]
MLCCWPTFALPSTFHLPPSTIRLPPSTQRIKRPANLRIGLDLGSVDSSETSVTAPAIIRHYRSALAPVDVGAIILTGEMVAAKGISPLTYGKKKLQNLQPLTSSRPLLETPRSSALDVAF